jgi:16S rRNA (guanine(966)-N(2))-methyltransferase RsmD
MRVISGSAKGIRLSSVPGKSTRPITDQVKEALFNIIGPEIYGSTFLDLFGGTGAVGIEALSRGAEHVVLLDTNHRAVQVIKQNLKATRLESFAEVYKKDAFVYLRGEAANAFDYIYIAPPQYLGLWEKAMDLLDQNPDLLAEDGFVIVQIHPKEYLGHITYTNYSEFNVRDYGDTILVFFEKSLTERDNSVS